MVGLIMNNNNYNNNNNNNNNQTPKIRDKLRRLGLFLSLLWKLPKEGVAFLD